MRKILFAAAIAGLVTASAVPAKAQFGSFGSSLPSFGNLFNGPTIGAGFGRTNNICPPFSGPCNPPVTAPLLFLNPANPLPFPTRTNLDRANNAFFGAFGISRISRLFGFP